MAAGADVLDPYRTSGDERREFRRVDVAFEIRCERVGLAGVDEVVRAVDLSPGGIRFATPGDLAAGDVVRLTIQVGSVHLAASGLVVYTSRTPSGEQHSHVAFTGLGDSAMEMLTRLLAEADVA